MIEARSQRRLMRSAVPALAVGAGLSVEFVHQIDDIEEPAALSTLDKGSRDGDGEMRFAGSGAADRYDVALMLEEPSVASGL